MGRKVGVAPVAALIAGSLFAVWTWLTLSTTALAVAGTAAAPLLQAAL